MSAPADFTAPFFHGLLRRRTSVRLTLRGWLAVLLAVGLAGTLALRRLPRFLMVKDSVPGGVLVVEGWVTDVVLARAMDEYRTGAYVVWCVTGEPLDKGGPLNEYADYATLTVAIYEKRGGPPGSLHAVQWESVRRDRTYASALALKAWLSERGLPLDRVNVVTRGTHARRSRLLYEKAFGAGTRVGVIAVPESDFDTGRWWATSAGFRAVVDETIAYIYARCFFRGR